MYKNFICVVTQIMETESHVRKLKSLLSWNKRQRLKCSLAVQVVWVVSHRNISVQKVKYLKLKIVRMLITFMYLIWAHIIERELHPSGLLRREQCQFNTDDSRQKNSLIFKGFLALNGSSLTTFRNNLSVTFSKGFLTHYSSFKMEP